MINLTIEGEHDLLNALKKEASFNNKRKAVRKNGVKLHKKAVQNANFNGHYEKRKGEGYVFVKPTGATKRSIALEVSNLDTVAKVTSGTNYSGYLETGTRFMEAQPFMKPALDGVIKNFIKDLARTEE
ncbi:TPA: HK97-gp10 family putative phage morphogenesis protein [Streptococcus agalactiae]|nr:hypothetical protein [Streptococcus agalactiae]HEO5365604.1 hypothetical protein [Streptococcus agalactiae]